MFRFFHRPSSRAATPPSTRHLLRRAGFFGAALVLLWLALQLAPQRAPAPPTTPPLAEATARDDGVAVRSRAPAPGLFSAGNIVALVLLLGGVAGAVLLRRRSRENGGASIPLQSLGHMSLAPNQQLRLVRCGDDVLLLGVTAGQITLLKAYDSEAFGEPDGVAEHSDEAMRVASASVAAPDSFASLLRQQVRGAHAVTEPPVPC